MFRVATEFVDPPTLFLMCDQPHCGRYESATLDAPAPAQNAEQVRAFQINSFVKTAADKGWVLALDGQCCPEHARKQSEQHQLIQVANGSLLSKLRT